MTEADHDLRALAELHGVMASYRDVEDRERHATQEALLGTLAALGVDVASPDAATAALAQERVEWAGRTLEPVVATFASSADVPVRLAPDVDEIRLDCALAFDDEGGERREWSVDVSADSPTIHVGTLPFGYHQLHVSARGVDATTTLIVAPPRAYEPPGASDARAWGVFLPLYALRSDRGRAIADLDDLGRLARWVADLGGSIVGTLPLLPAYLGGAPSVPTDPSPYSPVSRLFWNELYLDLERAPESAAPEVSALLSSPARRDALDALRREPLVDYVGVAREQAPVLDALARAADSDPARRAAIEKFAAEQPLAADYAAFRGAVARHGSEWWNWPSGPRDGRLRGDDVDADEQRRHLYAQFLAAQQVRELADDMRALGGQPYLDLPIGVRADGYDVWRYRDVFADADAGAPPDSFFTAGQNWSFPPLHPQALRESSYAYLREVLRHHLELADVLRIDHVMGLHRLYWIPAGHGAGDGAYVRYPADELYAVVTLESHRHRARIIGENLGTVPPEVDVALEAHGVGRMYVVQYEALPKAQPVLPAVPADAAASINTHDMPTFAAWWGALDVDDRVDLGLMDLESADQEREARAEVRERVVAQLRDDGALGDDDRADHVVAEDSATVLAALVEWLGRSRAAMVLVNLEDLWLEEQPQNTPGTVAERTNWRRRASASVEDFTADRDVEVVLRRLDAARRSEHAGKEREHV
ncbi:MAG: 4-alpha-glucanotransferase [Actinobacteria bacterium]|nr:4-alpha-glucanotransferase [Actinomycetota bacterium]